MQNSPTSQPASGSPGPSYTPGDFGAPMLLLVSLVAIAVSVGGIIVVGATDAGWAVGVALIAALTATAAVIVYLTQMLSNSDGSGT